MTSINYLWFVWIYSNNYVHYDLINDFSIKLGLWNYAGYGNLSGYKHKFFFFNFIFQFYIPVWLYTIHHIAIYDELLMILLLKVTKGIF